MRLSLRRRYAHSMRRRFGRAAGTIPFKVTIDTGDYEMSWTRHGASADEVRAEVARIAKNEYGSRARVVSVREAR